MLLRITDGTTTITLNDDDGTATAPLVGARYFPRDPGNEATVTETADVVFDGSNSVLKTQVNHIERLLAQASQFKRPTVYVEYHHGITGYTQRSPLVGGRVVWNEERIWRQVYASPTTGELAVIWERANYWEGPDTFLALTSLRNGNATPYNSVTFTPEGTLPAPLRVQMTNNNGIGLWTDKFYLTVDHILGLGSSESFLAGGTTVWSEAIDHDTRLFTLPIPDSLLTKAQGEEMQVLAAFSVLSSGLYLRASLYTSIGGIYQRVAAGNEREVGFKRLLNLGTLPVPPGGKATTDMALVLSGYMASGGSATLEFVQLTPARHAVELTQIGYQLTNGDAILEDSLNEQAYYTDGGNQWDIVQRSGGPLLAQPGVTNRLHLLFDEGISINPSRSMLVNVNYRPRRATI